MCTPFFILSVTAQFLFNDYYFYRPTLSKRLVLHGTSCWSVHLSLPKQTSEPSTHPQSLGITIQRAKEPTSYRKKTGYTPNIPSQPCEFRD